MQPKDIWQLLDAISKATYTDGPWALLLEHHKCVRDNPQNIAPCPCVWRRPKTGAMSKTEEKEYRWDWRSCKAERNIRLALQHREPTPIPR